MLLLLLKTDILCQSENFISRHSKYMVDTISVYMDSAVGSYNGSAPEYAPKDKTYCVYDSMCIARVQFWSAVCTFSLQKERNFFYTTNI